MAGLQDSSKTIANLNIKGADHEKAADYIVYAEQPVSIAIWEELSSLHSHFGSLLSLGDINLGKSHSAAITNEGCSIILAEEADLSSHQKDDQHLSFISNHIDETMVSARDIDLLSIIGVQKHLCAQSVFDHSLSSMFNLVRLSDLRRDMNLCEVVLRDSEHIVFDLSVIRQSDFPVAQDQAPIVGITTEEACQLMKFAGSVTNLKSITLSSVDFTQSLDSPYYKLISLLLWYFLEGTNFQTTKTPISHKKQYVVYPDQVELPLYFYNESMTDRWWVNTNDEMDHLIACSPSDYEDVRMGQLSDRMMKILERLA